MADPKKAQEDYNKRRERATGANLVPEVVKEGVEAYKRGRAKTEADRAAYRSGKYDPADTIAAERALRDVQGIVDPVAQAAIESARARGIDIKPQAATAPRLTPAQEAASAYGLASQDAEGQFLNSASGIGMQQVSTVPNKMYGPTAEKVAAQRDALDRQEEAHGRADEAASLQRQTLSDALEEENQRQRDALIDRRALEFAQEKEQEDAMRRTEDAYRLTDEAVMRASKEAVIDPERWWNTRTDGQKAAAFIGTLGRGLAGRDPAGFLNNFIERDIAAQQASFNNLTTVSELRGRQGDMARGLYQDLRSKIADKRVADEAYRIAKLEQMRTQFEALTAKTSIPLLQAKQDEARAVFDMAVADARHKIAAIEASNAKFKTVVSAAYRTFTDPNTGATYRVPVGGAGDKMIAEYMGDKATQLRETGGKFLASEIETGQKIQGEIAVEGAKQAMKAAAGPSVEAQRLEANKRKTMADAIREPEDAIAIVDGLLALSEEVGGGVPGKLGPLSLSETFSTQAQRDFDADLAALHLVVQRWASGAHLSPQQTADVMKMVPDRSELTGGRMIGKLRRLRDTMQRISTTRQRVVDEPTRQGHYRAADLPTLTPGYSTDSEDPTAVDE